MAPSASKRKATESARKREARENEEALKLDRELKKGGAKARKTRRKEAEEDDLLVEREGDSAELTQLRVLTLKLESDNQRMRTQLVERERRAQREHIKTIAEPKNIGCIDIELIRLHTDTIGEENDFEWNGYRGDARECLNRGSLDPNKRWSKQSIDRQGTVIHALEARRPKLKAFANHWAAIHLLKECHNNIFNYRHKQQRDNDTDSSSNLNDTSRADDEDNGARVASARKAALSKAVERKALKLRAREELEARRARDAMDKSTHDESETEIDELPSEVRRTVERDEIGVPSNSQDPLKPVPKQKRAHPGDESSRKLTNTPKGKQRSVIPMEHGRGGKLKAGGRGGCDEVGTSRGTNVDPDGDELSDSSGQTTSDGDDE